MCQFEICMLLKPMQFTFYYKIIWQFMSISQKADSYVVKSLNTVRSSSLRSLVRINSGNSIYTMYYANK